MSLSPTRPFLRPGAAAGRLSMYRLTVLLLLAVTAWSFLLSLAGALYYSPADLAALLAVTVSVTLVSSRVMGLLLRTRPHTESSVITALILFFLFWPSTAAQDLTAAAVAAAAATVSKYLLAWRRRHIFNPAALGAFTAVLVGLPGPAWWVAAPLMLVAVLPAAALLLWRTRLAGTAAVFAATALAGSALQFQLNGTGFAAGLWTALASFPVVFLAGFMLTEPLTLPPRRSQRLVTAGLVGVLFCLPLQLGPVHMSPELALLIGNAVAFGFGQRGAVTLRLAENRTLTPTARELVFEPARPVRFSPGQYMELSLPHAPVDGRGSRRTFSISTGPGGRIGFGLRVQDPPSTFKAALLRLAPGATVTGTAVGGDFTPPKSRKPLLLIASGIGITPFIGWLRSGALSGRDVVLVYSVASAEEAAYAPELRAAAAGGGLRVLIFCREEVPGFVRAADRLPDGPGLRTLVPDVGTRAAYASGSPGAVAAARRAVRAAGGGRTVTDAFTGY